MFKLIYFNKKGQALLESLLALVILFMSSFAFIEVVRYLSFRSVLSSITSDLTRQISFYQLTLIENQYLNNSFIKNDRKQNYRERKNRIRELSESVEELIAESLSKRSFSFFFKEFGVEGVFRFDIKSYFIFTKEGVYLKVNTCLPALFSSFIFNKDPKYPKQNCLGHFRKGYLNGEFEWRVRSSAFSPWPPSGKLFYSGITLPFYIKGLSVKDSHFFYAKQLYQVVINTQRIVEEEEFEKVLSDSLISER